MSARAVAHQSAHALQREPPLVAGRALGRLEGLGQRLGAQALRQVLGRSGELGPRRRQKSVLGRRRGRSERLGQTLQRGLPRRLALGQRVLGPLLLRAGADEGERLEHGVRVARSHPGQDLDELGSHLLAVLESERADGPRHRRRLLGRGEHLARGEVAGLPRARERARPPFLARGGVGRERSRDEVAGHPPGRAPIRQHPRNGLLHGRESDEEVEAGEAHPDQAVSRVRGEVYHHAEQQGDEPAARPQMRARAFLDEEDHQYSSPD